MAEVGSSPSDRIRDAGKWLIGASAAVGAALIAGSQLSDIGALPLCSTRSEACARLPLAVVAAAVALVGIAYVMWRAVQILLPVEVSIDDLIKNWAATADWPQDWWWYRRKLRKRHPEIAYFRENPGQIGNTDPETLKATRTRGWEAYQDAERSWQAADTEDRPTLEKDVEAAKLDWQQSVQDVEVVQLKAQYRRLLARFERMLPQLLLATVITAVGITGFAWATNPGTPSVDLAGASLRGANLSGVDLGNANLDGADLTGADLAGAGMGGTSLKGVIWNDTTCPDGTNSDSHLSRSCLGHLSF